MRLNNLLTGASMAFTMGAVLQACAYEPNVVVPVNEEKKALTHQAYKRCMAEKAEVLDDGISPANVVGAGIATACYDLYVADAMVLVENDNAYVQNQFRSRLEQSMADGPTQYVLSRRNYLKTHPQPKRSR